MLQFGRFAQVDRHSDGLARPKTFNFFGFRHFVASSRGNVQTIVGRKTKRQGLCSKLKAFNTPVRQPHV
jgi:hypothetical protein